MLHITFNSLLYTPSLNIYVALNMLHIAFNSLYTTSLNMYVALNMLHIDFNSLLYTTSLNM